MDNPLIDSDEENQIKNIGGQDYVVIDPIKPDQDKQQPGFMGVSNYFSGIAGEKNSNERTKNAVDQRTSRISSF